MPNIKQDHYDVKAYYVRKTNCYSRFKFVNGNREIKNIDKNASVKQSIIEHGYYRLPILVNEKYEIIEGQHRFQACKELGLPIFYIIQNGLTAEDCAPINSYRKNWVIKDYVHLYASEDIGYRYFELLTDRFGFKPSVVFTAMGKTSEGSYANTTIKKGLVECDEKEYREAECALEFISQFKNDMEANRLSGRKNSFYIATIFAWRSELVNRDLLAQKMHKYFYFFGDGIINTPDAISKIEKIYNYRTRAENQIDLIHEYKKKSKKRSNQ